MGMIDYHVNRVSEKILKKVCKKEYTAFKKGLEGIDIDQFACDIDRVGEFDDETFTLYTQLQTAFRKATNLHLSLGYRDHSLGYHDERGNAVSGGFWEVEGVYDFTPATKKFIKKYGKGSLTDSCFCTHD